MVKLTQIDDETEFQEQKTTSTGPVVQEEADFEDEESEEEEEASDDEFEDDFDINETLCERISALKDIIPAQQRTQISNAVSTTYNLFTSGLLKCGSFTWCFTTGALLLGVPLSLSILAEQQLMELEKEFKLQQGANDILASGDAAAPAAAAPATA
ncbi:hypothetical protein WICPIJ_002720 [Wickerhamomyces pijperi]|uniref:Mitochondrial import receptor subunit TOM22 n=1 Tax=Wickerhamomyces pijperi TaxID=599730 RepID=A0A9P8TNQ8_WICPI|nr:hypothetical protein WICPIJ_002720 [Wickerhamomyces pijperi]